MNITVEQELNFPDTSFLTSVLSVAQVTSPLHYAREHHKLDTTSSNNSHGNNSNTDSSKSSSSNTPLSRLLMASSAAAMLDCNDALLLHVYYMG